MEFPEEGLDDKFWSISALNTAAVTHPPTPYLSPMAGSNIHVHGTACTQFVETRVGKKDLVLQISEICALIAASNQRCEEKEEEAIVLAPPIIIAKSCPFG